MSGRPPTKNLLLAQKHGVRAVWIKALGGADKLLALSEEARAVLIKSHHREEGRAPDYRKGGMVVRGFERGAMTPRKKKVRKKGLELWELKYDFKYRVPVKGWKLT